MACRDGSFSCGCEGVMLTIPFLAGVALKFESTIHPAFSGNASGTEFLNDCSAGERDRRADRQIVRPGAARS